MGCWFRLPFKAFRQSICVWNVYVFRHRFMSCLMARAIWEFIPMVWASISGEPKFSSSMGVSSCEVIMPFPHSHIVFRYLRCRGLWHNRWIRSAFVFYVEYGWKLHSTIKRHTSMQVFLVGNFWVVVIRGIRDLSWARSCVVSSVSLFVWTCERVLVLIKNVNKLKAKWIVQALHDLDKPRILHQT
mgnify:CR=1 FL=1